MTNNNTAGSGVIAPGDQVSATDHKYRDNNI